MKIALISPKGSFLSKNPEFMDFWNNSKEMVTYRSYWSGVSPGLLIVAALTPPSFDIEFIDENNDSIDFTKYYDLVGISAMTQQAVRAYQIADEFRKRNVKVVVGGIHATILPEEAKQHADSVLIGEAEYLWPSLIEDSKRNKLLPFYKSDRMVDLKDAPIPRYDLLKGRSYPVVWVQTTRGCPHDCEFCAASTVYGKKYRNKSVEQVINEIKLIKKIFGNIQIGFGDDNMFVNKDFSKELLEKLVLLNIRWFTQSDISVAEDDDLLDLLRRSGCMVLFIGLESLSKDALKMIDSHKWKLRYIDKYIPYIKKIQSHGIGVMGAFIIGFDNDDLTVFKKTADFIIDNNLYAAQITILTPLPGTRLRKIFKSENRLLPANWENYTCLNVNFMPKKISISQLEGGLLEVYKKVYSKEAYLRKIKYFKEIYKDLISV